MTVNNGSQGYEVSFLQATLSEKFDPDTAVTGTYDLDTHKKLIQYLRYPDTSFSSDVENKLCELDIRINESNYRKFNYVFSINTDIGQLLCTQKAISYVGEVYGEYVSAKYLADSIIDTVKPEVFKLGWYLTYEINDQSKFVVTIKPISQKDSLPKSTMLGMVNLAGLDYLDGYTIKGNKIVTDEALEYDMAMLLQYAPNDKEEYCQPEFNYTQQQLLAIMNELIEKEINTSILLEFEIGIKEGDTKYEWKLKKSSPAIYIESLNDIIEAESYTDLNPSLQVRILRMINRIYFINNIDEEKYFNFLHSFDMPQKMHIYFCRDYLSSSKAKNGVLFDFFDQLDHGYSGYEDTPISGGECIKYLVPPDWRVFQGRSGQYYDPIQAPKGSKSIAVEIKVPERNNNKTFEYKTYISYYDYHICSKTERDDYLKRAKGSEQKKVKVNNIYHYLALKVFDPCLCVEDIDTENMWLTESDLENGSIRYWNGYIRQVVYKMEKKPEYLLVYESDNYNRESPQKDQPSFRDKPYLIHDMFFDYLLGSSIHENSEEERIDMVRKLIYGEDNKYEGYTDKLKKDIQKIQKDNNIPFETGFVDTQTLYLLRGDE